MPDTTLQLGDFEFARFEVPEQIAFGGEQRLVVHELVGGIRVIDAMGDSPQALEWSGLFVGQSALDRALYLDGLRKAGQPLTLTWSQLRYTVLIRRFECQFQRFYRLPYRIQCEVLTDDTTPVTTLVDPSPEQLVDDDLDAAMSMGDEVGDGTLTGLLADVSGAISAVGSFASASPSLLGSIARPLAAARSYIGTLLGASDMLDGNVGGIVAGGVATSQVSAIAAQITAATNAPTLISLDRTLGRIAANVGAVNSGTKSITTVGGDLFTLAAQQYGDVRGWTAIAEANALSDPALTGIATLTIPPLPAGVDGILNG